MRVYIINMTPWRYISGGVHQIFFSVGFKWAHSLWVYHPQVGPWAEQERETGGAIAFPSFASWLQMPQSLLSYLHCCDGLYPKLWAPITFPSLRSSYSVAAARHVTISCFFGKWVTVTKGELRKRGAGRSYRVRFPFRKDHGDVAGKPLTTQGVGTNLSKYNRSHESSLFITFPGHLSITCLTHPGTSVFFLLL